jgi:hypothetical protein
VSVAKTLVELATERQADSIGPAKPNLRLVPPSDQNEGGAA